MTEPHPKTYECDPTKTLLRGSEEDRKACPPVLVQTMMRKTVEQFSTKPALRVKREGVVKTWTYADYQKDAQRVAKSLIKLGFAAHDVVLLMGFNAPEWALAAVGAIFAGGIEAGVYASNGVEAVEYQVQHSQCEFAFVENEKQAAKYLDCRSRGVGRLKHIVLWGGTKPEGDNVYMWDEFLAVGDGVDDAEVQKREDALEPGHACSLIYTSGTTGPPKAVMISHDNVTFTSAVLRRLNGSRDGVERVVSYLPLSHIAAQMLDVFCMVAMGGMTYFAPPTIMKEMVPVLQEVRPTIFFGVPRVWEKIEEKMKEAGAKTTGMKRNIAMWAKGVGRSATAAKQSKHWYPWGFWLADRLVFSQVREKLGLTETKRFYTGAAPIKPATLEFFAALHIPILEIYGMSECTGPETCNTDDNFRQGTAGRPFEDSSHTLKIHNPDDHKEGEVCWTGRHVMMGYMHNEEETKKAIDEEGFLHSGDLGTQDADGFVRITGRIKELLITAGGENIPPVLIENEIKKELEAVSNAMVIGDQKKYLTVLLTLKSKVDDKTGEPTNELDGPALRVEGSKATTLDEAAACDAYKKHIEEGIKRANSRATSNAQRVQYFRFVPEFTEKGGELTPTLKLKRKKAAEKHSAVIEEMYPDA